MPDTEQLSAPRVRRDQIIEAAYRCLGRSGLQGLRMRDVAAEAGVNIATVHYYVPSKVELVRAVVTHAHTIFQEHTAPPEASPPARRLKVHLTRVFDRLATDPLLGRVLAEVALHSERDPVIAEIVEAADRRWQAGLRALLPPGHDRDAGPFCRMVMLTVKGACLPPADARAMAGARRALLRTVDLWFA